MKFIRPLIHLKTRSRDFGNYYYYAAAVCLSMRIVSAVHHIDHADRINSYSAIWLWIRQRLLSLLEQRGKKVGVII